MMNTAASTLARPTLHPASGARARNIVAVASGKGGVGKTWLAVTLAHVLAARGARTLLFDGDLGLANVDLQLGLMPERDLGSVVAGHLALAEVITPGPVGFDVIAGKSGSGALAMLGAARLVALREELVALSRRYDQVIVDLGAGVDAAVRTLAAAAGMTLVIATDEPTALTDAYAFIKLTAAESPLADLRIVVNMAGSPREGERTYAKLLKACEGFLRLSPKLAGVLRRDERVRDAIRHQTALLTRHPAADAAADVEALATRLGLPQASRR
jgi:flagellar biosynthesis protein FlhG